MMPDKIRTAMRKAQGLCVRCGTVMALPGHTQCASCLDSRRVKPVVKDSGWFTLCPVCGGFVRAGHILCSKCLGE
jgi:hypothetical protein